MTGLLKRIYHHTQLGKILIFCYHNFKNIFLPDSINIAINYKKNFGQKPNLKNPKTLNEKIQWLKINDRSPLHTQCADKYAVRDYVSSRIGSEYLVPLYFHTKNVNDLVPENLPDVPFIIKTNHDSGGGIILKEKSKANWAEIQKKLEARLKTNYYKASKEWQYKNIKPRIIVEKLLQDRNGDIPLDYKLHCFNAKVEMIQVDIGRGTKNHYRNWYSKDWKREPYRWSSPKGGGVYTDPSEEDVPKPKTLEKMIALSEELSKGFDYVRVDLYDVDGKIYFGELTFHHDGGYQPILPKKWDLILGQKLTLSKS
ncbi:glycosyl transferase [Flavobacteriaceae bacterium TP-CH-4]|uniref:Glycosyl transferase n=1 Tax=Pelagihabitans pacificus TaxID=2696054 RepID=A0A967AW62_9FLAO|nr:ATP-grasp fold amidoligase family protein [Pelagihabitans pacificus]NHF61536.1 glycosyl transferase [Pelagihabitans pacificus]